MKFDGEWLTISGGDPSVDGGANAPDFRFGSTGVVHNQSILFPDSQTVQTPPYKSRLNVNPDLCFFFIHPRPNWWRRWWYWMLLGWTWEDIG